MNSGDKAANEQMTKAGDSNGPAPTERAPERTAREVSPQGAPEPERRLPIVRELHPLLVAMRTRWGRFDDSELWTVKTRDDLSAAIKLKYGITAEQAKTQVTEWSVGREF